MRTESIKINLPAVISMAAIVFAFASGKVFASDGEPPMASAVRDAIESIAPETYPDYVWTFIRRGGTVKIKGNGPDKVVALFGLSEPESGNEIPILTLSSLKTYAADGSVISKSCNASGVCRVTSMGAAVSAVASAKGKAASGSKSNNGKGKGKN